MRLRSYFEWLNRSDGSPYVALTSAAPEWLRDAVREAHDDEGPNDWRHEKLALIADAIDEAAQAARTDWDDIVAEIAENMVDIYNSDLYGWLQGHGSRAWYVDEATGDRLVWEALVGDTGMGIADQIRAGQYRCIEQMARVLVDAWQDAMAEAVDAGSGAE